jgi:hypothetical protein
MPSMEAALSRSKIECLGLAGTAGGWRRVGVELFEALRERGSTSSERERLTDGVQAVQFGRSGAAQPGRRLLAPVAVEIQTSRDAGSSAPAHEKREIDGRAQAIVRTSLAPARVSAIAGGRARARRSDERRAQNQRVEQRDSRPVR